MSTLNFAAIVVQPGVVQGSCSHAGRKKIGLDAGWRDVQDKKQEESALAAPQMMMNDIPFEPERRAMIERQLRRRGIRDERVLKAMFEVPRHEFVSWPYRPEAYDDRPLEIGDGQTISQPYMVAAMTEAAQVEPGDKVLEIGTGSGYQAAVLAQLGAEVITMERIPRLAESARERLQRLGYGGVRVIPEDGSGGYPAGAPYAAILVTAAAPEAPPVLMSQLDQDGRLVIPVGSLRLQTLKVICKQGDGFSVQNLDPCQFVPLVGRQAWPERTG